MNTIKPDFDGEKNDAESSMDPQYGGQLGCLRLDDGMEFYSEEGTVTRAGAAAWKAEQMRRRS